MLDDLVRRDDYVHQFGQDEPMRTIRRPADTDAMQAGRRGAEGAVTGNFRAMVDRRFNRPGSAPPPAPPPAPSPVPPSGSPTNVGLPRDDLQEPEVVSSGDDDGPDSPPTGTPPTSEDLPDIADAHGNEVGSIQELMDDVSRADLIAGMQATERERVAFEEEAKGAVKASLAKKPEPPAPEQASIVSQSDTEPDDTPDAKADDTDSPDESSNPGSNDE